MTIDVSTLPAATEPAIALDDPSARLARGGGWWTFILALAMLLTMTEALNTAAWSEGLEIVRLAVLGGALLAFALSLTRWEGLFPALYSVLASFAWITTLFHQLAFTEITSQEALRELAIRNANWFAALISGTASADNLIFVTQLTFLGWWIGYLVLWNLIRYQRVLHAAIPVGVGLLVNVYYSTQNLTSFLVVFLGTVLLLAIRLELARNELRWQLTRVRYAPDIAFDFLKAGLGFTVLVLVLAWTLPNAAEHLSMERLWRPFESSWQRVEDTWNRMYRSLNYGTAAIPVTAFGKTTTLGGAVSLTERPIFQAQATERTYWRAAAYDTYTGAGWINTDTDVVVIDRYEPLGEPLFARTREMTATIQSLEQGQTTIFAPPQPVRVSVPLNADFSPIIAGEDETLRSVSLMRSRVALESDSPYQVVSAITEATLDELRRDSTDYPAWINDRYLQLPDNLPPRIEDLAARITMAYGNPYDKAEALELVLRTYTYNQQIAAPPPGVDGVDYFLFDIQEGYCDYYASAMVVMLRAVGVPARFVVGYTPGQPVARAERPAPDAPDIYRALERNAHAWPEVYFPTYGWIQFEPTASELQIGRPTPAPPEPLEAGQLPDMERGPMDRDDILPDDFTLPEGASSAGASGYLETWLGRNWGWFAAPLLLGAAALAAWWLARLRQVSLTRDREALTRLFGLVGVWAARLRIPWQASQTPLERAFAFNEKLPEAAPAVNGIAHMFVAQQYGRQQLEQGAVSSVVERWGALQPVLWRRWLMDTIMGPNAQPPELEQDD